jgi:hypothetical protein
MTLILLSEGVIKCFSFLADIYPLIKVSGKITN